MIKGTRGSKTRRKHPCEIWLDRTRGKGNAEEGEVLEWRSENRSIEAEWQVTGGIAGIDMTTSASHTAFSVLPMCLEGSLSRWRSFSHKMQDARIIILWTMTTLYRMALHRVDTESKRNKILILLFYGIMVSFFFIYIINYYSLKKKSFSLKIYSTVKLNFIIWSDRRNRVQNYNYNYVRCRNILMLQKKVYLSVRQNSILCT